MLQKNIGIARENTEGQNSVDSRKAFISHPWTIERDQDLALRNSGAGFILTSIDNSTAIVKILVGRYSIGVQFRDLKSHQEVIAKSKHRSVRFPDDLFMSLDDEDEANALFVSWNTRSQVIDQAKNIAFFFNLLTQIENETFMNALCCLCDYLDDENSGLVRELLAFYDVNDLLNNKAYARYVEINLSEESRWYLITELIKLADTNSENQSELFTIVANLCEDVPSSSVHYKEANQRLLELTFQFDSSDNNTQKTERIATRLRCALRAEDQRLIDLTFHELCNEPSITPTL